MTKLHQLVAVVEGGLKQREQNEVTRCYQLLQKKELFNGLSKTYRKLNEDDENLPSESKRIQMHVPEVLDLLTDAVSKLWDAVLTVDCANQEAVADLEIGGVNFGTVPATFLIWLSKRLQDLENVISAIPVLDPQFKWELDTATGTYKTEMQETTRTKKISKPIVLYQATPEHPAQTQMVSEDIVAGYWQQQWLSGALPLTVKRAMLSRLNMLKDAVKTAREEANQVEVQQRNIGAAIMGFILTP